VLAPTREGCAYVGPPASRWIACHGCVRGNLAWLEGNWCALISASPVAGVSDPRGREGFQHYLALCQLALSLAVVILKFLNFRTMGGGESC
jgi:hypothetical protein